MGSVQDTLSGVVFHPRPFSVLIEIARWRPIPLPIITTKVNMTGLLIRKLTNVNHSPFTLPNSSPSVLTTLAISNSRSEIDGVTASKGAAVGKIVKLGY